MWIIALMFLTLPTTEELQGLELSELIDMLATHASYYAQLKEGHPFQINALKQLIQNIQAAIEIKETSEKNAPIQTQQSSAQDIT